MVFLNLPCKPSRPMRSALLALLLMPVSASALERDLLNAVESVGGIYSSIYIHEAGHALVYQALGASDVSIEVPRRGTIFSGQTSGKFSRPLTQGERQLAAVSGLAAANLAGELVLQRPGLHRSPYAQAVLGTALISNVMHVTQYYTKIRGVGGYAGNDIDEYELAGGNPHVMSAVLVGYTVLAMRRMQKKEIPLFYVNLRF
ncbi:hypothetical protein [Ideonella margarita]|uniref:Uncharacterized protein n=1 Tax=Ideonella margarita TaxID=2984191 RepID=A0ABU9C6F3_9BURK